MLRRSIKKIVGFVFNATASTLTKTTSAATTASAEAATSSARRTAESEAATSTTRASNYRTKQI